DHGRNGPPVMGVGLVSQQQKSNETCDQRADVVRHPQQGANPGSDLWFVPPLHIAQPQPSRNPKIKGRQYVQPGDREQPNPEQSFSLDVTFNSASLNSH